jgi:hypothetical protein
MAAPSKPEFAWEHLSDDDLLEVRLSDLGLRFQDTDLPLRLMQLHDELADRGILLRPRCYLSDEWHTGDGEWSIGVPFFLAHPRLKALEFQMMLNIEGSTPAWFMRLLRHEAAHALDHAYRLSRRADWQRVFGSPRVAYRPELYSADAFSRAHVRNLPDNYAQAHPFEDFAETFAVWLNPLVQWRTRYKGWPALKKLRFVDRLMKELAGKAPPRRKPRRTFELSTLRLTLRTYYERKFKLYEVHDLSVTLPVMKQIFKATRSPARGGEGAGLIRKHRRTLMDSITSWSGERRVGVTSVVDGLAQLCEENRLALRDAPEATLVRVSVLAATLVANRLHAYSYRLPRPGTRP